MAKSQSEQNINCKKNSTAVGASTSSVPSCYHPGCAANNTIKKNNKDAFSLNNHRSTKSALRCPSKPNSVGTSLCIATKQSLRESIFAIPKIPKERGKAGGANVNLGYDDSGNGGVSGSGDGSVMGATSRGRAKDEAIFTNIMICIICFICSDFIPKTYGLSIFFPHYMLNITLLHQKLLFCVILYSH